MPDITRIVTLDATTFKVWDDGVLKSTHVTPQISQVSFTQYKGNWYTFRDDIDSVQKYDSDFERITGFDMTNVGSSGRGIWAFGDKALIYQYSNRPYFTMDGFLGVGVTRRSVSGNFQGNVVASDGTHVYAVHASGNTVTKSTFTYTPTTITITNVGTITVAAGTKKGISVYGDKLYILYPNRLIKTYNIDTGTFVRNEPTLGTSGDFNDIFVYTISVAAPNTVTLTQPVVAGWRLVSRRDTGVTGGFGYDGTTIYKGGSRVRFVRIPPRDVRLFGLWFTRYSASTGSAISGESTTEFNFNNDAEWTGNGRAEDGGAFSREERLFVNGASHGSLQIVSFHFFDDNNPERGGEFVINYTGLGAKITNSIIYNGNSYVLTTDGILRAYRGDTQWITNDNRLTALNITASGTGDAFGVFRIGGRFFIGFKGGEIKQYRAGAPNYGSEIVGGGGRLDPRNNKPVGFGTNGVDRMTCYDESGYIYTYQYVPNNKFKITIGTTNIIGQKTDWFIPSTTKRAVTQKLAVEPDHTKGISTVLSVEERPTRHVFLSPTSDHFVIYENGAYTLRPTSGTNEIGIVRYRKFWYTCDNNNDNIIKYNPDFTLNVKTDAPYLTTPQGMAVYRNILLVVDLADDRVNFLNGDLTLRGEGALHSANRDPRGITADENYIYVIDNGENQIFRYTVNLTTFSLTLVSRWNIRPNARGISVFRNKLQVVYTSRHVYTYNKNNGADEGVAFRVPTPISGNIIGPQGLYVDWHYGGGIASESSTSKRLLDLRVLPVTQKIGIKPTTTKRKLFLRIKRVTQKLAIKPTATKRKLFLRIRRITQKMAIAQSHAKRKITPRFKNAFQDLGISDDENVTPVIVASALQKMGIDPNAVKDRLILRRRRPAQKLGLETDHERRPITIVSITQKLRIDPGAARHKVSVFIKSIVQKLGIDPDGMTQQRVVQVPVTQKIGMRPAAVRDRLRLRRRRVTQNVGIKPEGAAKTVQRLIIGIVQKLGISTGHSKRFYRLVLIVQKVGLAPSKQLVHFRKPVQTMALSTATTKNIITEFAVKAVQKLALYIDTDTMHILRPVQKLGISKGVVKDRLRLKPRKTSEKLGLKTTAVDKLVDRAIVTQNIGVKTTHGKRFELLRAVTQKLGIHTDGRPEGRIHVNVKLGISAVPVKTFFERVTQKLRIAKTVVKDRIQIRAREAVQNVGIKDYGRSKFTVSVRQGLYITKTAVSSKVERLARRAVQKVGIVQGEHIKRVINAPAWQGLGIKPVPNLMYGVFRSALQTVFIHVSGGTDLPSTAPLFHLKDRIRRSFRV